MAYLTLFLPKISGKFTEKILTFGEGGGQAGWAKFPTFTENLFWRLPFSRVETIAKENVKGLDLQQKQYRPFPIVRIWTSLQARMLSPIKCPLHPLMNSTRVLCTALQ